MRKSCVQGTGRRAVWLRCGERGEMEGNQVGRGQIMEGLVACAKEAEFYSQCNANSLEGISG